jgi:hypothetical protein
LQVYIMASISISITVGLSSIPYHSPPGQLTAALFTIARPKYFDLVLDITLGWLPNCHGMSNIIPALLSNFVIKLLDGILGMD